MFLSPQHTIQYTQNKFGTFCIALLLCTCMFGLSLPKAAHGYTEAEKTVLLQKIMAQVAVLQIELAKAIANESTSCFNPKRTLSSNMVGGDVAILQKILMQTPSMYPNVQMTGVYDSATINAVKTFQRENDIATDISLATPSYGIFNSETASVFTQTCKKPNKVVVDTESGSVSISTFEITDSTWNIQADSKIELSFTITNSTDVSQDIDFDIRVEADSSGDITPGTTHGKRRVGSGSKGTVTKVFKAEDFEIGDYEILITIDGDDDKDSAAIPLRIVTVDNDDLSLASLATTTVSWNKDSESYKLFSFTINNDFFRDTDVEYEVEIEDEDNDTLEVFDDEIEVESDDDATFTFELDSDDYEVGTHTIRIEIDPDGEIEEENENNNKAAVTLIISEN